MAAPTLPFAPSAVAPVAKVTRHDMRRVIAAYEQRIFNLDVESLGVMSEATHNLDSIHQL